MLDKGSGFVRIDNKKAIQKIQEQLGDTILLEDNPTPSFATQVRNNLCSLNKKKRFTKREYERIYPSDPIVPRMYGTIKAHKPEKDYPMRTIVYLYNMWKSNPEKFFFLQNIDTELHSHPPC